MYGQGLEKFCDVRICNYNTVGVTVDFSTKLIIVGRTNYLNFVYCVWEVLSSNFGLDAASGPGLCLSGYLPE